MGAPKQLEDPERSDQSIRVQETDNEGVGVCQAGGVSMPRWGVREALGGGCALLGEAAEVGRQKCSRGVRVGEAKWVHLSVQVE